MLQNVRFVLPGPSKYRSWGPGTSFLLRGIGPGKSVSICTFFLQRWIYISTEILCQVKHNIFLFRELLSFWVGSSLSLYWEGLIIKSIDIIDHTCVTWFVLFWSIKNYLPPDPNYEMFMFMYSQNMKFQTRLFDFRISPLHARSSPHPLLSSLGSSSCLSLLRSGSYLTTRSSKNRAQRVQKNFKFAFHTDGSWSHKHHHAPFNTHPCHLVSRTQRPGWFQRPKNLGSRVALLPGKFLCVWKVFAHLTEKNF